MSPPGSLRGAKAGSGSSKSSAFKLDEDNQEGDDGELPSDIVEEVIEGYWAKYDDLRLFFFREVAAAINAGEIEAEANVLAQLLPLTNLPKVQEDLNTFFLPSMSTNPSKPAKSKKKKTKGKEVDALPDWMETYESDSDSDSTPTQGKRKRASALGTQAAVHSIKAHTNAYTDAFESALFRLPIPPSTTRTILAGLHGERGILAHWAPTRRVRLADWLGTTVDNGGPHAMLAMNGLFVLMTTYNLDYPRFYDRLYALLDANVLHLRYRARFFRLLDTFLRSPLLSAALIASFIKRLSRLALSAPPAGVIMVIPFIYNLFKRHPGAMVMLHRLEGGDAYDPQEERVMHTKAIESSVWELASLKDHYLASIATLAKIFSEQFTKPEFNMEDFLDHGYGTVSGRVFTHRSSSTPRRRGRFAMPRHCPSSSSWAVGQSCSRRTTSLIKSRNCGRSNGRPVGSSIVDFLRNTYRTSSLQCLASGDGLQPARGREAARRRWSWPRCWLALTLARGAGRLARGHLPRVVREEDTCGAPERGSHVAGRPFPCGTGARREKHHELGGLLVVVGPLVVALAPVSLALALAIPLTQLPFPVSGRLRRTGLAVRRRVDLPKPFTQGRTAVHACAAATRVAGRGTESRRAHGGYTSVF